MFECTRKTCCLITRINQGSKVTSKKLAVLFCSAWNLALYCKILNENIQCVGVTISWSSNSKLPKLFWCNLEKHQNLRSHNFGNTGPIKKIPTLLISEGWDLSHYKIPWILVRVRWNIQFCWITWHGMTQKQYCRDACTDAMHQQINVSVGHRHTGPITILILLLFREAMVIFTQKFVNWHPATLFYLQPVKIETAFSDGFHNCCFYNRQWLQVRLWTFIFKKLSIRHL